MKRFLHYIVILTLTCSVIGCEKGDVSLASPDMVDPLIRLDNPGNAADHEIYLFYKESGITVLYNDTISRNPVETVRLGYRLTSTDSLLTVRYLNQQADILTGLNFVKTQIAPYLPEAMRPYSFLLTDSVFTQIVDYYDNSKIIVPLTSYVGMKALAISYVPKIKDMSTDELKIYRKDILKDLLTIKINENSKLTESFFAVSKSFYNLTAYGNTPVAGYYIPYQQKELYGFLSDGTEDPNYYATGSSLEDISRYLDVILVLSPTEFNNQYKDYPLVMQKYQLMLNIFKDLGFVVPQ